MSALKYWGWTTDSASEAADHVVAKQEADIASRLEGAQALLDRMDGPRDEVYEALKPFAWDRLRRAVDKVSGVKR